jgi:micrococcal nuclease
MRLNRWIEVGASRRVCRHVRQHCRERPRASTRIAGYNLIMMGRALAVLLVIGAWGQAAALELPADLVAGDRGRVASVIDGSTFSLADGRTIRLAAVDVPRPAGAGERAGRRQAIAISAHEALSALLGGGEVALAPVGRGIDRYGRLVAQVADAQGRWVQAEMVARGFARVTVFADEGAGLRPLLGLEADARTARRGLWALPEFRVIGADEAARHLDSFQLIEGPVRAVERKSGRTFLNFGEDWRNDFTVAISAKVRRQLVAAGLDPAACEGKMVRVRGWIRSHNGPLIELVQPEQIEVIAR